MSKIGFEYLKSESKRDLDLIGSIALLTLAMPITAGFSILSAIDTKDNPFFIQQRIGKNGRTFNIHKLRTISRESVDENPNHRGSYDFRAKCIGKLLRKTGLDELPQLANVISGEMSLVGIRPVIEEDLNYINDSEPALFNDWYSLYQHTRPGITGMSQIYRKSVHQSQESWQKSMKLDLNYAEKASLKEDLKIIAITPIKLISKTEVI